MATTVARLMPLTSALASADGFCRIAWRHLAREMRLRILEPARSGHGYSRWGAHRRGADSSQYRWPDS